MFASEQKWTVLSFLLDCTRNEFKWIFSLLNKAIDKCIHASFARSRSQHYSIKSRPPTAAAAAAWKVEVFIDCKQNKKTTAAAITPPTTPTSSNFVMKWHFAAFSTEGRLNSKDTRIVHTISLVAAHILPFLLAFSILCTSFSSIRSLAVFFVFVLPWPKRPMEYTHTQTIQNTVFVKSIRARMCWLNRYHLCIYNM